MRWARRSGLGALLAEYEKADYTYSEVGATGSEVLPAGYHHTRLRRPVGEGEATFRRAATAVSSWEMQRGSGMQVAVDGPVAEGRTVLLRLAGLAIPCRVVYIVDAPNRQGFAYGTLPDHPEFGEEAFVVTIDDGGRVWLEITAFSRPGSQLVALAGPLNRLVQHLALRRYHRALVAASKS